MSATLKFLWQLFLVNSFFLLVRIFRINLFYILFNFFFFTFVFIVIYAKLVESPQKGKEPNHQFISKNSIRNAVGFLFAPLETMDRIVDAGSVFQNILIVVFIIGAYFGRFISSVTFVVFMTNLFIVVNFLKSHNAFKGIYNFFGNILGKIFNPQLNLSEPVVPFQR